MSRTAVALALAALVLYLPGFWWGAPHATAPDRTHAWGVDDETPLGPLAEIHNIIEPKPDRNYGYPLAQPFLVAAAYAPYLAYLRLRGQWYEVSATYPFGLRDPTTALKRLTWIAHLVSVAMAVGIVLGAFVAAEAAWDQRTAVLAALFAMLSYPMFYYARTANVDVPVLFFIGGSVATFARCLRHGYTNRRAIWLGAWIGLALAAKEAALGVAIGVAIGLLAKDGWRGVVTNLRSRSFWQPSLIGLGVAVAALAVGSGFVVDPGRYINHLRELTSRLDMLSAGDTPVDITFPYTLAGHLGYVVREWEYLSRSLTVIGLLLALGGLLWVCAHERRSIPFLIPAIAYFLYMFFTLRAAQLRYAMPLAFLLAFPAARAAALGWAARRTWTGRAVIGAATAALALALLRGVSLTYEMVKDSRYAAAAWFAARTRDGDRVEYFGASQKLPAFEAGVVTAPATEYFGMYTRTRTDVTKAEEIAEGWDQRRPRFVLVIPDHTSARGVPHSAVVPPALYEGLLTGQYGYRLAAQFHTGPLFAGLAAPPLDYPTVNPPIRVFERVSGDD